MDDRRFENNRGLRNSLRSFPSSQAGPSRLTVDPRLILQPQPRYPHHSAIQLRTRASSTSSTQSIAEDDLDENEEEEEEDNTNEQPSSGLLSPSPTEQSITSSGSASSCSSPGSVEGNWLPPNPFSGPPVPPIPFPRQNDIVNLHTFPRILPIIPYMYNSTFQFSIENINQIKRFNPMLKYDRVLNSIRTQILSGEGVVRPFFSNFAIAFVRENAASPIEGYGIPGGLSIAECLHGVHMQDAEAPVFLFGENIDFNFAAISFAIRWPGYERIFETDIMIREESDPESFITRRGLAYHIARYYLKYTRDIDFSRPRCREPLWKLSDIQNTAGITWHQIWIHGLVNTVGNVWQAVISIRSPQEALRGIKRTGYPSDNSFDV